MTEPLFETDEAAGPEEPARRRRPRWRRVLAVLLASGLVLGLLMMGGVWYLSDRYLGNVDRIPDVFAGLAESERPPVATPAADQEDPPTTFLLVGSDSRADQQTTGNDGTGSAGSQRSDVLMLLQVSGDRDEAYAISIPRDSWVPVPGYGVTKINAAYAFGGPTLLIQTVEQLTNIRIDHFAAIDFEGFRTMTDALGGVTVQVAETTTQGRTTFTKGLNHLDGDEALAYVRQRYRLPGGDFDRVQRHQNYLRSVMNTVTRDNVLTDPPRLDRFLLAVTGAVSVDDELSDGDLLRLALSLRDLRPQNVAFLTIPVDGTGMEGAASVVYVDDDKAAQMWDYLRGGTLSEHLGEFTVLPAVPR
ncbi:N/A [soil metagenome]